MIDDQARGSARRRLLAALLTLAVLVAAPALASHKQQERQQPQQQQQQQGAPAAQAGERQGAATQQTPAEQQQEPPRRQGDQQGMTPEELAAQRLVEQILREEEGVLMGRDIDYDPAGRRDPFRSLLVSLQPGGEEGVRPPGLPGFLIGEVELKAIANAQGRWHCLLLGPDQRTYIAAVGSELYDGHIVEIRPGEVVFEQQIADLSGARRTRPVIKQLRTIGEN